MVGYTSGLAGNPRAASPLANTPRALTGAGNSIKSSLIARHALNLLATATASVEPPPDWRVAVSRLIAAAIEHIP